MATVHLDHALADELVNKAVRSCADIHSHGESQRIIQELQNGNCEVCGSLSNCLARQVGIYLGQVDRTIKAVYRYEPEYSVPRPVLGNGGTPLRRGGINLVAWVGRKSAASTSLGAMLESVLAERRKKLLCKNATPACNVLDIQMVEEKDVLESRSQAMMVNCMFLRSVQVWKRSGVEPPPASVRPEGIIRDLQAQIAAGDCESATDEVLFSQAQAIEKLPLADRRAFEPRLQEIKVTLIRRLLSDQPVYIEVAKNWLTISDLSEVSRRRIGFGRVGGEAAGLVLAARILKNELEEPLRSSVLVPDSFYLGADLLYSFMAMNRLMRWNSQKYKPEDQIRSDYPLIHENFLSGEFPPEIMEELRALLRKIGHRPLIARSSSLLEDSFGSAFAGKYEFVICPNQATPEENLKELTRAIARIYASTLSPEALLYRQIRGLRDYDERMGILIQPVQGESFGKYFLPTGAGVALSRNLYRWSPKIRLEDGFVRLVWGLGTSAVERASNNPPRLVALSHPTLQPSLSDHPDWSFSQQFVDVIDLEANEFKTLPVTDVISPLYPSIRLIAQHRENEFFTSIHGRVLQADVSDLAVTFDDFLRRTEFAPTLIKVLRTLETQFRAPVDLGFTVQVLDPEEQQPDIRISLLHCRRQDFMTSRRSGTVPTSLPATSLIFKTNFMVPRGCAEGIRHVVFVSPDAYDRLPDADSRNELRLAIYHLNNMLGEKKFICVGPGQWGANNPRQGVYISYADVHNAAALVELYKKGSGTRPDPALGTYPFQDLMEARIFPLTINLDLSGSYLNRAFFFETPNKIEDYFQPAPVLEECLRLIEVADFAPGCHLSISMDDERGQAVAYVQAD